MGDGRRLVLTEFPAGQSRRIEVGAPADSHMGGDAGFMGAFLQVVRTGDGSGLAPGPEEPLAGHLMAFPAERSRLQHRFPRVPP